MIVNGNYEFLDFDKIKPLLIDAFVSYYGEEFRDRISDVIDEINYHGYHSEEYVSVEYFKLLQNHRKEIVDIVLKKFDLPYNGVRENILLNNIEYPDIWKCLFGGQFLDNMNLTDEEKANIHKMRKLLTTEFCLSDENPTENFLGILKLRKTYRDAVREIERKYNYDVFKDIDLFDKLFTDAIENFKKRAKEIGYIGDLSFFDTIT
jgi:hypothetical protein